MFDLSDVLRNHVEEQIRKGNMECQNCGERAFDVQTWQNAEGVPRGAAVCRNCERRTDVTMSKSELEKVQQPLDELEDAMDDLQDTFDNL